MAAPALISQLDEAETRARELGVRLTEERVRAKTLELGAGATTERRRALRREVDMENGGFRSVEIFGESAPG